MSFNDDPDMVGIASDARRAIRDAEAMADRFGVLPDDPEKRKLIIDRFQKRVAKEQETWKGQVDGTVVRVDDRGIARRIRQDSGIGFLPGTAGRRAPTGGTATWRNIPNLPKPDVRGAAQRFHRRIVDAIEKHGHVPTALRLELQAEGWKEGTPITRERIEQWTNEFQQRYHAERRNTPVVH